MAQTKTPHQQPTATIQPSISKPEQPSQQRLEQWFAKLERLNESDPNRLSNHQQHSKPLTDSELATRFVARFGLRSAKDVMVFLTSAAGKSTQEQFMRQLIEQELLDEELLFEQQDYQLTRRRLLSYLVLAYLYSKSAKAKQLNEFIQAEIDKMLKEQKDHSKYEHKSSHEEKLHQLIQSHAQLTNALQKELKDRLHDSTTLEHDIDKIEQAWLDTSAKYELFNDYLNHIHLNFDDLLGDLSNPNKRLTQTVDFIEKRILAISTQLQQQADKIMQLLESNDPRDELTAKKQLIENNACNLQLAALKEMLQIAQGDIRLYRFDGSIATSFADADFCLSSDKRIVRLDEQCYLIPANKEVHDLSYEERDLAQQNYQQLRLQPSAMSVKKLVNHNHESEQNQYNAHRSKLSARSEAMQHELDLLAQQLTQVQAARANTEFMLNQLQAHPQSTAPQTLTSPSPRPTPKATNQAESEQFLSSTYRQILLLMKNNPSNHGLQRLRERIVQQPSLQQAVQTIDNLTAGKPIPEPAMRALLAAVKRLDRQGHLSHKELYSQPSQEPKQTEARQFNPSPFHS
ncbi:MAG: hypothetical protein ACOVQX_00015 [Legionella sp.]